MVGIMRENTASFIIVFFTFIVISGFVYKVYHVDCDPQAVDKFNEFISKFEECFNGNCGSFSYADIPSQHEISIESRNNIISVELFCKGKKGKTEVFENVGLCVYSAEENKVEEDLEEIKINKAFSRRYGVYPSNNAIELRKEGNDICFVNPTDAIREDFSSIYYE